MKELIRELVTINSVFPNEKEIGEYLYNALKERGFSVEKQEIEENRFNVLGTKGEGKRTIGFYAHMDTVPVQGNWVNDPFFTREKDGSIIGLGAYDMKSGIAAILRALEGKSSCKIKVAFGIDEENNSLGATKILEKNFFSDCDLVIVPEINDSPIQKEGVIMLGRRGRVRYEIDVFGQSCHGASGGGVNAIREASKLVEVLESMEPVKGEHMQGSQFVNAINGEAKSLSFPEVCRIEFDVHLVNGESAESVLEKINGIIKETGINAEARIQKRDNPYLMPYWTEENEEIRKLSSLVQEEFGELNYSYGKSVADECIIAKMAPVVSLAPLGGNAHREEEWVNLKSVERISSIYRKFIE